jgi:indole-3-acetate monooxygenase
VLGGRARIDAPLYRFPTLGLLALGVSAVAIGIARHALESFMDLAGAKVPTGSSRTLANRAGTQKDLARASVLVESRGRLYPPGHRQGLERGAGRGRLGMDRKAELRLAATNNAWSAAEAVDLLYHGAGGSSIYESQRSAALLPRRARGNPAHHGRPADLGNGGQGHARHRSQDPALDPALMNGHFPC